MTSVSIKAQNNAKGIYIVNANSKVPLQDVSVKSNEISFNAITDDNGFVDFKNMPATAKQFLISCIGYQSITVELSSLTFLDNIAIIGLTPKVSSLQEIKVIASANNGIFKTISDLDIHLRPINNSQEVLRIVPGLFIGQHAGGGKAEQIFLRGFDWSQYVSSSYGL